ncbi:hypothetical protein TrLO_g11613 [Triparma laevis f. longispina]|uniref:Hook C-terminal domain-containing protein n=1 Tax=Triparma laevis f. longispina TaxID=1714387 RepID=A0A9W7CDK8_9STRA|nr:hypothetical protein TrLO_g11613 [Triparma laevis f. longispina]
MSSPTAPTPTSSLLTWLSLHIPSVRTSDTSVDDLVHKGSELLNLAQKIYNVQDDSSAESIKPVPGSEPDLIFFKYLELTSCEFRHNSPVTSTSLLSSTQLSSQILLTSISNLLIYSVSSNSPTKDKEVKSIMGLDRRVQKNLMRVIEKGVQECEVVLEWEVGGVVTPRKEGWGGRGGGSEVKKLRVKNTELDSLLASLQKDKENLKEEITQLKQEGEKKQLSIDLETMEGYEQRESGLKKSVEDLTAELSKYKGYSVELKDLKTQTLLLRDENDVLKYSSAKCTSLETQLGLYKDKCGVLSDVKIELEREQEKCGGFIDQIVKLEKENKEISGLKKSLETYKKKSADLEVELELKVGELNKISNNFGRFKKMNLELGKESEVNMREVREMQRLLVESYGEVEEGGVLGGGVSEFNSEVKEELVRLRGENEELRKNVEEGGEENLRRLKEELEDGRLKGEGFKGQLLGKKEECGKLKVEVKNLKVKVKKLEEEVKQIKKIGEQEKRNFETKIEDLNREHSLEISDVKEKSEEEITEVKSRLEGENSRLNGLLEKTAEELKSTFSKLTEISNDYNLCSSEYEEYKNNHSLDNATVTSKKESYESQLNILRVKKAELEVERDGLEIDKKKLIREKAELEEDLDRTRMEGHRVMGVEGDLEASYEALQREYNGLLEESKVLRREALDNLTNVVEEQGSSVRKPALLSSVVGDGAEGGEGEQECKQS